jgi:hypothetical protein
MPDPMTGPITQCPWCSAPLNDSTAELCPACGAALRTAPDAPSEIKGVTTLDTEAILRARSEVSRPRSRILSFLTGEAPVETGGPASADSLAPPAGAVQREMLRLRLEAQRADLAAETVARKSDELARLGIHVSELGGDEERAEATPAAETTPAAEAQASWPAEPTPGEAEPTPGEAEPTPGEAEPDTKA